VPEIIFEKDPYDDEWHKIQDDPDDEDFEIVETWDQSGMYGEILRLQGLGWKVRQDVDPEFNGFILFKSQE
jgi:hypothetical protein